MAAEADFQGFDVDDRAKVLADQGGGAGVAEVPLALGEFEALPAVVGFEGIAAGRDEIEAGVEFRFGQGGVGAGSDDFLVEVIGVERRGAGGGEDVLAEDIPRPWSTRFTVQGVSVDSVEGGLALDDFEAVGGDEEGL